MWPLMIASALMSANKAQKQAENHKQNNLLQAELTKYSPWTGMRGQIDTTYQPNMLEAAFQGGVQGAAMGQSLGQAFPDGMNFFSAKPGGAVNYPVTMNQRMPVGLDAMNGNPTMIG